MAFSPRQAMAVTIGVAPAQAAEFPMEDEAYPTPISSFVTGCLDTFFQSGLIATDAPAVRIAREEWLAPSFGFKAAREGLLDYYIALYLTWKPSAYRKGTWFLSVVEYRLVRVSDGSVVLTGTQDGPEDREMTTFDADRSAESCGASVASVCISDLAPVLVGGKQ